MDSAINRLRQAHAKGYIVGLKEIADNQGGPQKRFEIDELIEWRPDTFNLFILAFQEIKELDPTEPHSFYQIAGIHGLPKVNWMNVETASAKNDPLVKEVGYCVHGDVLFPSWHRPYMALLEQTLFLRMIDIAERFPPGSRARYKEAATKFRFPYWDYFRPRGRNSEFPTIRDEKNPKAFDFDYSIPAALTIEKLMIRTTEKDELTLIDNPLRFSRFPKENPAKIDDGDWLNTLKEEGAIYSKERTFRHPTKDAPDGDRVRLNKVANMRREDNTRYILNVLLSDIYKSIGAFATDEDTSSENTNDITSGSMEALHNDYHGIIGGIGGHMSNVPIAAFDPIFFLHHTNIDRYFAIWQAANPDKWFSDPQRPGEPDKETQGLVPFKTATGGSIDGFWTAKGCRDTKTLGYIYGDADGRDPRGTRDNFKRYYEWSRRLYGVNYQTNPFNFIDLSKKQAFQYGNAMGADYYTKQLPDVRGGDPSYNTANKEDKAVFSREYYIDNKVSRLALNGAFTIFWFIEEDMTRINKTNPKDFVLLPSLAGLSHVFAAPVETCSNCEAQQEAGMIISNTKPITSLLLDYVEVGKLESFDPEHVVPFLQDRLTWRIVRVHGELVDPATVENFSVAVTVKATPLPRSENKKAIYLSYPQVAQKIANDFKIQQLRDAAEKQIREAAAQLDKKENWASVGKSDPKTQPVAGAITLPTTGTNTTVDSSVSDDKLAQLIRDAVNKNLSTIVDDVVAKYRGQK